MFISLMLFCLFVLSERQDRINPDGAAASFLNRLKAYGCKIGRLVEYFHHVGHHEVVRLMLSVHGDCCFCQKILTKQV